MTRRRVAITGLGIVSPYGDGVDAFFEHLLAGHSAVRHLQTEDRPRPLSMPFVRCDTFDPNVALGKPLAGMMERFAHLGVAAAFEAWNDAGLARQASDPAERDQWACIWGTALGGILAFEKGYRDMWQNGARTSVAVVGGAGHEQRRQRAPVDPAGPGRCQHEPHGCLCLLDGRDR